jgi:hypothetical protein
LRYHTLACQRRLAAGSRLELVVEPGLTPGGVRATARKSWSYQVREAFAASFSCERENAQAACLPIRP